MRLHIENMSCGGCASAATRAVLAVDPQAVVSVEREPRILDIQTGATADRIKAALAAAGYPAVAAEA